MKKRSVNLIGITTILMASFVGSRILGLARDIVISNAFGTSASLDAYFAAFSLPDTLFQLLAGAALASAFIPVLSGYLARGEDNEGWKVASSVLNLIGIATALLATLAYACAPLLVQTLYPVWSGARQSLTIDLTRIMLLSPVLFSVSGIVMGILNTRQHFLLPAVAPLVYNISIICGAVILGPTMGVYGLAWGVVAGSFLHLAVQLPGLVKIGLRYKFAMDLAHPGVKKVGALMLPRVLGLAAVQVNFLVNIVLASTLEEGSVAAIKYAWLLMMMPLGIFGMAISTAVFPTLAEQVALDLRDELRRTLISSLRLILFLTIPASVGLILLREPLVALLFQRGQFDEASTRAVAWALLFYAIGLSAHAAMEILTRAFYALQDTKTPVAVGIAAMFVNVGLSLLFIRFLGHGGLALSMSLATIMEAGASIFLIRRRIHNVPGREFAKSFAKTCLASAIMAGVVALLLWVNPVKGNAGPDYLLTSLGAIGTGGISYFAVGFLLKSDEVEILLSQVRQKMPGLT